MNSPDISEGRAQALMHKGYLLSGYGTLYCESLRTFAICNKRAGILELIKDLPGAPDETRQTIIHTMSVATEQQWQNEDLRLMDFLTTDEPL